ncbi:MAG: methyl-accepting chemotaxis protein [Deltaproteobacteria bacterium]|nr:methyl-accepting chemotaxis protein [Deltaproteobacteria bacterium]
MLVICVVMFFTLGQSLILLALLALILAMNLFFFIGISVSSRNSELSLLISNIPAYFIMLATSFVVKDCIALCVMLAFTMIAQGLVASRKFFIVNIIFASLVYGGHEALRTIVILQPIVLPDNGRLWIYLTMSIVITILLGSLLRKEKSVQDEYLHKAAHTMEKQGRMLTEIRHAVHKIRDVSRSLKTITDTLVQSSGRQDQTVSEISASVEEISMAANEVGNITDRARQISEITRQSLYTNTEKLSEMEKSFDPISEQMALFHNLLMGLVKNMSEIEDVLSFNESIGDKIKVLSVNAAIEASKAGAAGQGFSVVSQEMQELVSSTESSLEKGHSILNQIKSQSDSSTRNLDDVQQKIAEYQRSLSAIRLEIADTVRKYDAVSMKISEMTTASDQQRIGMSEINSRIGSVRDVAAEMQEMARHIQSAIDIVDTHQETLEQLMSSTDATQVEMGN